MGNDVAVQREQAIRFVKARMAQAVESGLIRRRVEDQAPNGETITIDGSKLVNMGSCAYLALNTDERLKNGAIAAVRQYGPIFSSSTAYTSIDLYSSLESKLHTIFGGNILIPTTTTLGHLSVLPVLVNPGDLVLLDHQVHASVRLTSQILAGMGATVADLPHNDMDALSARLAESARDHDRVWYLADGIYSMFGDAAPINDVMEMLNDYPSLHVYFDDAHGVGWKGPNGRGHVLGQVPLHDRMIVIGSLAKSWGAGGSVLVLPDSDLAERVLLAGATFTFSGPLHPAELGAANAAADIHLSSERDVRAEQLMRRIDYVRGRLVADGLPALSLERTPLWYVRLGVLENAIEAGQRMMRDGFYVNLAGFPAVPMGMDGIRFTVTNFHSDEHLERFMDSLARNIPDLVVPVEWEIDLRPNA